MEALYGFASTVAAMAVICTLLEFTMPGGKLKSSVRIAAGILFVLAIAQPMVQLCKNAAATLVPVQKSAGQESADHEKWLHSIYQSAAEEIGQSTE